MDNCLRCKVVLTDENWASYNKTARFHICRDCYKIKQKESQRVRRSKDGGQHERDLVRKVKIEVLTHYGNGKLACVNPYDEHKEPYTNIDALSIDHINGNGTQHRREVGHGHTFYYWLRKHNYPEGYQTLCMNCQNVKRAKEREYN